MEYKNIVTQIALVAGLGCSVYGAEDVVALEPSRGHVVQAAHIYYNVATGERVVTQLDEGQTAPADAGTSVPVWSALVQNACETEGYSTEYYFGLDDPTSSALSTAVTLLDHADIALDTVVDCIQVNWVVAHPDIDTDSNSVGEGVEELAGQWIIQDADNGRAADQSTRLPLADFLFFNLPGNIFGEGSLTGYTLDVDLVGGFSGSDLSFEIGDSDGDCQTAAFCNDSMDTNFDGIPDGVPVAQADRNFDSLPDSDLDGDGYFDWSWSVRFYQPGIGNDFDSDGDTGMAAPTSSDAIGISFGFPEGEAIDNGDGTWTWEIDTSIDDAGHGVEDRFALYTAPNGDGDIFYQGGYSFGGFACTGGLISDGGSGYTPPAMFQFQLFGPGGIVDDHCDYNGDGVANFFDVSAFIQDFNMEDPMADRNNDGLFNFFDISIFIQNFNAGCP